MISSLGRAALNAINPRFQQTWVGAHIFRDINESPGLLLITREEFENGMRESFLEGQRFARENSIEGMLARTGKALADASKAMQQVKPTIHYYSPRPAMRDAMSYDDLMRKHSNQLKDLASRHGAQRRRRT